MDEGLFGYRKLVVYQHSRRYVKTLYLLMKKFPSEEKYGLCDQIRRAAVSITSNLAEAMGRLSDKDKLHFIEFAFSSLYETMSQIEIALDLEYITTEEYNDVESQVTQIAKMLSGLRKTYLGRI